MTSAREHAERAAAHLARMQRYEEIGTHWAETGAGKKQHEIEIAEERRILSEATIKEKADEDREKVIPRFLNDSLTSRIRL